MSRPDPHPMIPVPDAILMALRETARILSQRQTTATEEIPVTAANTSILRDNPLFGRVLDADVIQREPGYPPYRASIMDGFAISSTSSVAEKKGDDLSLTFRIVDKIYAGDSYPDSARKKNTDPSTPPAHYVTTGAIVPDIYDCVVPIELCTVVGKTLRIRADADIVPNKWIRPPGCDIAAGSTVVPTGTELDAVSLALLLQAGVSRVTVRKRVVVGILSTGNELETEEDEAVDAWESRRSGKIPDANRPILLHLVSSWGNCQMLDLGIVGDSSKDRLKETLDKAVQKCDVVVTSGGISMGESDILEEVLLDRLGGKLHFGRLHMKPGKPTTLVTIPKGPSDTMIFCLPGNPVSATVCSHLLLRPCLNLMFHGVKKGSHDHFHHLVSSVWLPPELQATLAHDIKLDRERPEYHRVILERDERGTYYAQSTGTQRSSRLMSLRDPHGLMILPQAIDSKLMAKKGEIYTVIWIGNEKAAGLWLPQVTVEKSRHLVASTRKTYSVGVILLAAPGNSLSTDVIHQLCEKVSIGLGDTASVNKAESCLYEGQVDDKFLDEMAESSVDVYVIVTSRKATTIGSHTQVANRLQAKLDKVSHALALRIRGGASAQTPGAAMFETVVGFLPSRNGGSMVIFLSDCGIDGAVSSLRGLPQHALKTARG